MKPITPILSGSLMPTITSQPLYTEIYRHGIDYRIPLKHDINSVVLANHLNKKYPEISYDADRNMIILVHYISAFDRYYHLPKPFKIEHDKKYDKWKCLIDMKNISDPILNPAILKLLFLSSKERDILTKLMDDPEIVYIMLNTGNWYEYFIGSPIILM